MVPNSKQYFDTLKEFVFVTDENMQCRYVNSAFCNVFGGDPESWSGKSFDLKDAENCEISDRPGDEARQNSRIIIKFTHQETPLWVEWLKTTVDDNTLVFTGRNITGRKENEASLKQLAAAANEASETKMRFLATMSHEMRTPLNGILGMTGLLLDTEIEPNQRAYADAIRESGSALLSLINDILDYSKVESGKMELEELTFDPRSLVQGVFELLSPRAAHKGLEVATFIDPSVPLRLVGDEGRLRQVLLNLVGNAIKFTEDGGVTLEAYGTPSDKPGFTNIEMHVRDSGIGIPEQALEKIFDEFAQADSSHARKFEGTGLGLAIARKITQIMGGTISVNSKVGKGSTFGISIPLLVQEENEQLEASQYIDDHVIVLTSSTILSRNLKLQLKAVGVQKVDFADNVAQCQRLLEENPGSTLLCDLQFATMHGQKLTRLAGHSIVLLSQMARGRLDAYRKVGFHGYLIKPVRQASLREWLTDKSQTPNVAATTPAAQKKTPVKILRRKLRILLAEDNKINALLATAIIKQAGHEVDVAVNGLEAVEQIQVGNFDIVLMDMRMPEMDGLDATREIRKLSGPESKKPIIALTANAMKSDRDTCMKAGMNDFLTKPFDPEDLIRVVERWVATAENEAATELQSTA